MQIALAGTGKMGAAMARRLMASGHAVTVWNRTAARAQPLLDEGATWAASPAALAASADIVLTMLIDEAALDEVYLGADGLLSGPVAGRLFIDLSTVSPAKPQQIGARVQAAGASFLECPVGGSVGPAKEGRLLGLRGRARCSRRCAGVSNTWARWVPGPP